MKHIQCDKEECFAYTQPRRYRNCCIALEKVIEVDCPFYKSKGEVASERVQMRIRAEYDPLYRSRLEGYGIKFKKRGRKYGEKSNGDGEG